MPKLSINDPNKNYNQFSNLLLENISSIKEFVNTSNSRLDAIISITNNSHAIAADAVTAMICEYQDYIGTEKGVNTTNKMSLCLRDGEIILRYVTYLLLTGDKSILKKSCLRNLKNTYISLGVPIANARRVIELIKTATISDIKTTANDSQEEKSYVNYLIEQTESYFDEIINLLD